MGVAYERGILLYNQKRYAMAADEFRRELAQDPQCPRTHAMLGLSLTYSGKLESAEQEIRDAISLDPSLGFGHYALSCFQVRQPIKRRPFGRDQRALYLIALRKAHRTIKEAIRLEPKNPDYLGQLAAIEFDRQKWTACVQAAERGLAALPTHRLCSDLRARSLAAIGASCEARDTVQRSLSSDPLDARAHCTFGWMLLIERRYAEAEASLREALRLNPADTRAVQGLKRIRNANRPIVGTIYRFLLWLSGGQVRPFAVMVGLSVCVADGAMADLSTWLVVPAIALLILAEAMCIRAFRAIVRWKHRRRLRRFIRPPATAVN